MSKTGIKARESIAFKSIATIVLILAVFSVIICSIGYNGFTEALLEQYSQDAFWTAEMSSMAILPDMIDYYLEDYGNNLNHANVREILQRICDSTGVEFIYVIQPDTTDYSSIKFIFSVKNKNSSFELYDVGYVRPTTNDDYREAYRSLYEGTADKASVVRDKGFIETDKHVTVMVPLKGEDDGQTKAILCVQVQMDGLENARETYVRKVVIVLVLLAIAVIVTQGLYLHFNLLLPVTKITGEATRFARENVVQKNKLTESICSKDEMGLLAESIDYMETKIHSYVENITQITAEKEKISTELSLAARIQADALPNVFPAFPDRNEFDIYASMNPAKEVGGDFYDFFLIDNDHLCLFIADVSGKGIPAALFMMSAKSIISNNAMKGKSPAMILADSNNSICARNAEEMFITVWLGVLEISTGKLVAANAGHEYPILRDGDGFFDILKDKHSTVLGGLEEVAFKDYEIQLRPGSKLFLYTDGVPEATNSDQMMFGVERMINTLNKDPEASPKEILENMRNAVEGFVKDAEQFDDVTMLCLEYK